MSISMSCAWVTILLVGLALACESSAPNPTPSIVTLTPEDTALVRGGSAQFVATVQDRSLDTLAGVPVQWFSLDTNLVTVSSTGFVQAGWRPGRSAISAFIPRGYSDTIADTVPIVVLDSIVVARANLRHDPVGAAILGTQAYITQESSSSVVRGNLTSRTFGAPITVDSLPIAVAFNSSGSRAYVANLNSTTVSMIDVATDSVVGNIVVGAHPYELIVAPGDSILYVTHQNEVHGIRLATRQLIVIFSILGPGTGIAVAKDTLLYVSAPDAGRIVEINLSTRTLGRTFSVGGRPQQLVVSPDENELYIANESGSIQFWNLETGQQSGVSVSLPLGAWGLARRASDGLLYASSVNGFIFVIDPIARTLIYYGQVDGSPREVAFTADGSIGIVTNQYGWVDFIK